MVSKPAQKSENNQPLLNVKGLTVQFRSDQGLTKAVDDFGINISIKSSWGIVGESGSGKTTAMLSIMRLLASREAKITANRIHFDGQDLSHLGDKVVRQLCGNKMAMIFQEPLSSLNPVYTIGYQIAESLFAHNIVSDRKLATQRSLELINLVGIPDPSRRLRQYPHQLSGGMRQRAMIAIALACDPILLIADEPTTALDVTIQAQILALLRSIRDKSNMSLIIISHNLGVIAETTDNVVVMYAGSIVEQGVTDKVFEHPLHPYTRGLLASLPTTSERRDKLYAIPGSPPSVDQKRLPGCKFSSRCPFAVERCKNQSPPLVEVSPGRWSRCWEYKRLMDNKKQ